MGRGHRAAAARLLVVLLGGTHGPGEARAPRGGRIPRGDPAPGGERETGAASSAARSTVATPAPPKVAAEIRTALEAARQRFEARDRAGVLVSVSERYRSAGLTKAAVREQLNAMFALYQELRARVTVDRVEMVGAQARIYTSGEVSGRLPLMGWVLVLTWQDEPEVARREAAGWRLFGFQD
jgi:hypothetical protein